MIHKVEVNPVAAAQAMTFVFGEQGRMAVENLYGVIDGAMRTAHESGYYQGVAYAGAPAEQEDTVDPTLDWCGGYDFGWKQGYDDGFRDGTVSAAQPDVKVAEPYEGDSGDETTAPDGYSYDCPLFFILRDWLQEMDYETHPDGADAAARDFMNEYWKNVAS